MPIGPSYGVDVLAVDCYKPFNFRSFYLSRALKDHEQLDLNKMGQDGGQAESWACGAYVTEYHDETKEGCHNNRNDVAANCYRLWMNEGY